MNGTSVINPKHYDIVIRGHKIQAVDVIEARFAEDAHLSQAAKYLLRAGHKTDSSYVKDVGKCIWWCVRALMFNKVKHIELPEGAPVTPSQVPYKFEDEGPVNVTPMTAMLKATAAKPKRKYTRKKVTKKATRK